MPEDGLEARVAAVERAVTDGEAPLDGLADAAELRDRTEELAATVADLEERVAQLEAAAEALRGYVGGVRALDRDVERRADLALAKAEELERALADAPGLRTERLAADGDGDGDGDGGGHAVSNADTGTDTGTDTAADTATDATADAEAAAAPEARGGDRTGSSEGSGWPEGAGEPDALGRLRERL